MVENTKYVRRKDERKGASMVQYGKRSPRRGTVFLPRYSVRAGGLNGREGRANGPKAGRWKRRMTVLTVCVGLMESKKKKESSYPPKTRLVSLWGLPLFSQLI